MDRLIVRHTLWSRLNRRALPPGTRRVMLTLSALLLLALTLALAADVHYLRSQPGMIPNDDVFAYECYARAFWRGAQALSDAPITRFCSDHRWLFWTAPPQAFHTLPREYPAPALAVFSLPLLIPFAPYPLAYMLVMALLVFVLAALFLWRGLALCALAFGLYVLIGGWGTVLERYDLVPGVLVLAALICAERTRYSASYLMLAAATLLKIYPGFLAPVLWLHQWRRQGSPPWREALLFILALLLGSLPAALLNPAGFAGPLHYNGVRPPQIESVPGSLLWLGGRVLGGVRVRLTYHSVNVLGALADPVGWLATALFVLGVAYVSLRAWQQRDTLQRSTVLAVLVMLCTGKILSPQYLLWLFPVVAYVEGLRLRWLLVALLTVLIYPYGYTLDSSLIRLPEHPLFMLSILGRNALLLGITAAYLRWGDRPQAPVRTRRSGGRTFEYRINTQHEGVPGEDVTVGSLAAE